MALQAVNLSPLAFSNHTKPHTRINNRRSFLRQRISASATSSPVVSTSSSSMKLTYLEINSWLWDISGVNILVDPILVGNLDFGLPWLFDGAKKFLRNYKIDDLPELDCLLITQSLDDHCHIRTLTPLSKRNPDLPVIATPNAESILQPLFCNVTYLEPGEKTDLNGKIGSKANICATAGPVLGPPWQRPENEYIVKPAENGPSLYYEPHCVYNDSFLENYRADVVITPVVKQLLPSFTLVSRQEDAIKLAKLLQSKYIVPMRNGDVDTKGILASILSSVGTMEAFKEIYCYNQNKITKRETEKNRTVLTLYGKPDNPDDGTKPVNQADGRVKNLRF